MPGKQDKHRGHRNEPGEWTASVPESPSARRLRAASERLGSPERYESHGQSQEDVQESRAYRAEIHPEAHFVVSEEPTGGDTRINAALPIGGASEKSS